MITNPRSRANQGNSRLHTKLEAALGDAGELAAPEDLDALERVLAGWRDRGVGTVVVNGGDGTAHRVVTAMVRTWGADLPRMAVLPAGTMNIIANSVGVRGRPHAVLRRLVERGDRAPTQRVWTLKVSGDGKPVYGFLFGNGIVARFLEVYYEGSEPSPAKAAWILGRGAASALIGGRSIKRLTRPFQGTLIADGVEQPDTTWTAIAVGTVEQLGLGFKAFHLAPRSPGKMHVQAIAGSVVDLARDLPRIYRGQSPARPGNRELTASKLQIRSKETIGYMVDGDFHQAVGEVQVEISHPVDIVVP